MISPKRHAANLEVVVDALKADNERLRAENERLWEALSDFADVMDRHGEWDDGCFYYGRMSAPELQEPIKRAAALLAKGATK